MADAQERLEKSDEKNFKFEQGRLLELRYVLDLEETAKTVLEKERTRKRISVIE